MFLSSKLSADDHVLRRGRGRGREEGRGTGGGSLEGSFISRGEGRGD